MKKLLALIMALCLLFTLAACGGNDTPSNGDDTPAGGDVVNLSDFEGVWKISQGEVETVKISASSATVTAYTADGFVISTFPVVATDKGAVLKMGSYGTVTLEDATALTITAEPAPTTAPSVVGDWENVFADDLPDDAVLHFEANGGFTQTGTKLDSGSYAVKNSKLEINSANGIFGSISYELLAGGKVMVTTEKVRRIFVKKDASDAEKSIAYQNALVLGDWKATDDANFTVKFDANGKILISGAELGIWFPSAKGATVEYSDGGSDELSYANGEFTLNYYGKTFAK